MRLELLPFAFLLLGSVPVCAQTQETYSLTVDISTFNETFADCAMDAAGFATAVGFRQTTPMGFPYPLPEGFGVVTRIDPQGNVQWTRDYGGGPYHYEFTRVALDGSGGAFACGLTYPTQFAGDTRATLVRFDANGGIAWTSVFAPQGSGAAATDIVIDALGNAWVTGSSFLARYRPDGTQDFLLSLTYPAAAIALDGQGGAVVAGRQSDVWPTTLFAVSRIDAAGAVAWTRAAGIGSARDIVVDAAGNVIAAGELAGTSSTPGFFVVRKYDAAGNLLWEKTAADAAHPRGEAARVAIDVDGNLVVVGTWYTPSNVPSIVVRRYDPSGALLRSTSLDAVASYPKTLARDAVLDARGFAYVSGEVRVAGPALALRVDPDGSLGWIRNYDIGPHETASAIAVGPAGSVVTAGYRLHGSTDTDARIVRVDELAVPFCFGDGSGAPCPCGNASAPAERAGCTSSLGVGARLVATGTPSIVSDSLLLHGSSMTGSTALYFQGTVAAGGGAGTPFGDGLWCAGAPNVRIGTQMNTAGASVYPELLDVPVSTRGAVTPGMRTYQVWYRNAAAYCTSATFNLTNGLRVTWTL